MSDNTNTPITVQTTVLAPVDTVWQCWTMPEHITKWTYALDTWHAPYAENNLTVGGKFLTRMEAKDGSMGFEFWGIYDVIEPYRFISYTLGDERKVFITFDAKESGTIITESFEAESENSPEQQKAGWQAIMDNFKHYVETMESEE